MNIEKRQMENGHTTGHSSSSRSSNFATSRGIKYLTIPHVNKPNGLLTPTNKYRLLNILPHHIFFSGLLVAANKSKEINNSPVNVDFRGEYVYD